jgi:hypothetical protein
MGVRYWNVTEAEKAATHPADRHVPAGGRHLLRAVDVEADPGTVYRWVCQIAVAPYSYDLIDNLGRRSPPTLTPGAEDVRIGQPFQIGPVVEVEPGRQITVATAGRAARIFGQVAITWEVMPGVAARSRILGGVAIGPPRGVLDRAWQAFLGVGDLVMMRRQLLNLKARAEATERG